MKNGESQNIKNKNKVAIQTLNSIKMVNDNFCAFKSTN